MPELRLAAAAAAALLACCCAQVLHREAYVSVPTLISEAGYPVERHRARTADGYHLQLHRIPAGRRVPAGARAPRAPPSAGKSKRAVLLVHGLFGSSSDFVIMGPRRSLAYLLADAGYDVWLGNLRGTTYSSHDNLTRHHPRFWDYSFAEHGEYDLPALVDAVLERTARTQLLYVGYSMGTTSLFVMLSKQPHYNDKLLAFLGLAPAVYLDGLRPLARLVLSSARMPERMRARGVHSLSLRREVLETVAGGVCRVRRAQDDVCMRLLYSVVGEDYEQNDWDMMPVVLARLQPGSLRQVEHFGKVAITGDFVEWGRGLEDQGAAAYNLSCTRVPVHLVYGENDRLTEKSQTVRLVRELRGARGARAAPVRWSKFNHLDFMFAKNLDKLLTHELVRLVNRLYKQHTT